MEKREGEKEGTVGGILPEIVGGTWGVFTHDCLIKHTKLERCEMKKRVRNDWGKKSVERRGERKKGKSPPP